MSIENFTTTLQQETAYKYFLEECKKDTTWNPESKKDFESWYWFWCAEEGLFHDM